MYARVSESAALCLRLACGQHDRVTEELEGDWAEEAFWSPGLHGCRVQVPLAEAVVPCTTVCIIIALHCTAPSRQYILASTPHFQDNPSCCSSDMCKTEAVLCR